LSTISFDATEKYLWRAEEKSVGTLEPGADTKIIK